MSIARRMSWASGRETTLVEDRAYSLMGIFGILIPNIHGEGSEAFIRLQLEIIRRSANQSIFAWGKPFDFQVFLDNATAFTDKPDWAADFRCLLASSPDNFKESANVVPFPVDQFTDHTHSGIVCDTPEYTLANYGIQIHLPLYVLPGTSVGLALLTCKEATTGEVVALYNANPRSSIAQGLASGYLRRTHKGVTGRSADSKSKRVSFVLFGSLLWQLAQPGDPGVGLRLTLEYPVARTKPQQTLPARHAAVLFRCHPLNLELAGDAFAIVFGIADLGTVWATVALVKPDYRVDGSSASYADDKLMRGIRARYNGTTDTMAESEGYDIAPWRNGTFVQQSAINPQRIVKVTLTRWEPEEEYGALVTSSVVTYAVGLEVNV
ncbi:hypothetical protein L227DRAFT_658302 [Lentinus tigrinus ALCF2SS1-6]|uniref:DUF8212 domain-containing protein n=2 Tax=Lentinus tigrinus TaxID=5365 RepID=A0A5C2RR09_9APHY|nr:hypothetical protein L227DRAFT_658302 [Lentinus tigrinus ALCF2SS1-6]